MSGQDFYGKVNVEIEDSRIDRLRACMGDYLRQRGLPLRKPFRCLSPAHEDMHPSMSYNPRAENVHCFSCGVTYDIFDVIGLDYGLRSFSEQLQQAREIFGKSPHAGGWGEVIELRGNRGGRFSGTADRAAELDALRACSDSGLSYFLSRGITAESCEKHGLFLQGGRAYFPVFEGGVCVSWSARATDGKSEPRYKNSPGPMGIWNIDVLAGAGGRIFITEGIIDAICLEQLGEKAVALCGSQNADKIVRVLAKDHVTAERWSFVACGDTDTAGEKMNAALVEGLNRLGLRCGVLPLLPGDGDVGRVYLDDRDRLKRMVGEAGEPMRDSGHSVTEGVREDSVRNFEFPSASSALEEFFEASRRRAERGAVSTGFTALDKLLDGGLHPGLYVIGAISSLGKTSFALQMADYIAEQGRGVLFFSLEQSRFELMAKSLSRISAVLEGGRMKRAFTSRQLLSGQLPGDLSGIRLMEDTREAYARAASKLCIREGIGDISAADVRRVVGEFREKYGEAPVVIVDYLQIMRPSDPRATDKQNTDRAVMELKLVSRDFDIPVIAISSFNRENYRAAVSMEAFKESGAVEYSSDVLFGLQLAGAGEKDFDVNKAKSREPRRLELVMLKNRAGAPYAKLPFEYRAKFSFFQEGT